MKDIVIIYHAECPDGFGAAWVAHKKFGDKAEYIAVHHNSSIPEGVKDKEVYLLDFAYTEDVIKELLATNKKVTALDHHVSREASIKMTEDYRYSIDNSGSVLAWMYFYPNEPVPKLLEYIEDIDLWKFSLKDSYPLCTFIYSFDYDFSIWEKLALDMENTVIRAEIVSKGNIMLSHEERLIARMVDEGARLVEFEGYSVYSVNAPHLFASRIGQLLIDKKPPLAIVWSEDKERINVSLRSDGSVDVSKIAEKYKGGGHKAAAGFNMPSPDAFPWKEIKM